MPNTLAHIGLQTPLTKIGSDNAPLQWIALACIIPDIPWIVQRILLSFPGIDPLSLRLYAINQASLFYCCILSLALSLLTRKSLFIFTILALNSALHLVLDACQIKWGNGVNLAAPFSWQATNFGFFWPEHFVSYLLIVMGIIVFIYCWPKAIQTDLLLQKPGKIKTLFLLTALALYVVSPVFFLEAAYNADMHYSRTILDEKERPGKKVAIDRGLYNRDAKTITCLTKTVVSITNPPDIQSGKLSIRGFFDGEDSIRITEYHQNKSHRDYASYVGLLLTLLLWLHSIIHRKSHKTLHRNSL